MSVVAWLHGCIGASYVMNTDGIASMHSMAHGCGLWPVAGIESGQDLCRSHLGRSNPSVDTGQAHVSRCLAAVDGDVPPVACLL